MNIKTDIYKFYFCTLLKLKYYRLGTYLALSHDKIRSHFLVNSATRHLQEVALYLHTKGHTLATIHSRVMFVKSH